MRTLAAIAVLAALGLLPDVASAHGGSEVAVTGHPHADGAIEIEGSDFEANEVVTLELRKQGQAPVLLGSVPVEADGTFEVTLHVPAEVRPGPYELVADAGDERTSAEATILERPGGTAPGAGATPLKTSATIGPWRRPRPSPSLRRYWPRAASPSSCLTAGAGRVVSDRRRPERPLGLELVPDRPQQGLAQESTVVPTTEVVGATTRARCDRGQGRFHGPWRGR